MANKTMSPTKVVIPCRLSFANIWEPKSINGGEEKYSVSCIIPKADKATLAKIQKAIEAAKEDAKGKKWGGKIPPNLKLPLRDGDIDRPDDENYADCMFLNATSKDAPQIVDRKVQPILDPMDCGSGDYANVSVNFYGFSRRFVPENVLPVRPPQPLILMRSKARTMARMCLARICRIT